MKYIVDFFFSNFVLLNFKLKNLNQNKIQTTHFKKNNYKMKKCSYEYWQVTDATFNNKI